LLGGTMKQLLIVSLLLCLTVPRSSVIRWYASPAAAYHRFMEASC
jgi:hypothetical protein